MVNSRVAVNQQIAKRNNAFDLGNCLRDIRSDFPKVVLRFADNLELALGGGVNHAIAGIFFNVIAANKSCNVVSRFADIPQERASVTLHK